MKQKSKNKVGVFGVILTLVMLAVSGMADTGPRQLPANTKPPHTAPADTGPRQHATNPNTGWSWLLNLWR